ncbi:uncharacterized protein CCOS01_09194 [Colletotrichum costaricense]|uniref:Uncharacterized protein n=1 Tax=Colletotrichum costaricense TaxID=1209916 RepID=A0AAI9YUY2_9PEZI|nr:uncharacterized protein CCOS01_09194 [Colletotrichum costaricense]KAK1524107.1 hypothetical protein CCOS01_09194 [Colletotrichum costaricense]
MGMNMEMRGEETWRAAAVEQGREVGGSLPKSGHANRAPGAGLGTYLIIHFDNAMAEYTLSSRIFGMLKKEGKCVDELLIAGTRYHNLNHSEEPPSRIDPKRQTELRRSFHSAPTARANVDGGGRDKKYASSLVCAGRLLSRVAGLEPRLFTKGDQPAPSDVMSPPAGRLGSAKKEPEELAKSGLAAGFTELQEEEGTKKMENKTGNWIPDRFALRKLAARSSPPAGGSRMDRFGLKSTGPSTAARPSSVRAKTECARASKPFGNRVIAPRSAPVY